MISINGKPLLATHWDGDPGSLGADLKHVKSINDIIIVASKYSINAARASILKKSNDVMISILKKNGVYEPGYQWLAESKDKFVTNISRYGDFAEYQYDLKGGKWRYRELSDMWIKGGKNASSDWRDL